jgi:hypothetical protein
MNTPRYIGLLAAVFGGAMLGGYLAQKPTLTAEAQVNDPVVANEFVYVPNDGLQFVNENGALLASLFASGGGVTFSLMDANGEASVVLQSSVGQRFGFLGGPGGSELQIVNERNDSGLTFNTAGGAGLVLASEGENYFAVGAEGNRTEMEIASQGESGISMVASRGEGAFELYSDGNRAVEITGDNQSGNIQLRDSNDRPRVSLASDPPQVALLAEDAATVWLAPPAEDGDGQNAEQDN